MNKRLTALLVSGSMGTSMLLGLAGCTPSNPQTDGPGDDPDEPTETADEQAPAFTDAEATLSLSGAIDTESARNQISSDLFGLFLEDINYASFALDDNMLINSSFENKQTNLSNGQLHGWSVGRDGEMEVETEGGVNSGDENFLQEDGTYVNEEHLKLTAAAGTILSNSGHTVASPITVIEGTDYVFSAFIKGYTGKITIEVVRGSEVYASGEINVSGADWVKYQTTITATGTMDETGSGTTLRLTFDTAGTVYLDNVKFETTDANEATGIKSYLYEAIEDLSPAFFRFPGGCIIEGRAGDTDEYFDWKNSIGAVAAEGGDTVPAFTYTLNVDGTTSEVTTYGEQATRSYNTDIWAGSTYYQMEYGLGYYEYFMLCEELGAKAIPIVNCGLSCMVQDKGGRALKGRHNNGIEDFIQDAFDLVAFAKGDPDSSDPNEAYWAQVRVNMGHAEPFDMDYIGIGNEQWGIDYERYYEQFLIAFNEKAQENPLYAEVEPIVGNCTMFTHCEDPDLNRPGVAQKAAQEFLQSRNCPDEIYSVAQYGVVDQHYYVNYTDLFYNHDLYDSYARFNEEDPNAPENLTYYKVFVGEYAANTNVVRSPGGDGVTIGSNDASTTHFGTTEAMTSTWINALSEAAMMTGMERNGDVVVLAAYAPMFGTYQSGARQWQVDMMYYTNTDLVRTPSYFVQQIFMQNTGDHKVTSNLAYASGTVPTMEFTSTNGSATRTVNTIYYVTSQDAETGDIIVKVVNAGEADVRFNVSLADLVDVELTGIAEVLRVVGEDYASTNDLNGMNIVGPDRSYKIGFENEVFGYEAPAMSVTAIRVRTK